MQDEPINSLTRDQQTFLEQGNRDKEVNDPRISDVDFDTIFNRDAVGQDLFTHLVTIFYNIPSFDSKNTHQTAYNEGQRSVISYIITRMSEGQKRLKQDEKPKPQQPVETTMDLRRQALTRGTTLGEAE